ncbi:glycosyltransferase family 92 protein [Alphaproteobacteria bacterium GH1-50]|uniref:Glycosyltransferase family 92 protein n=1 Tax=Kangsaoukella pontilimi TaxID=2691042 RepID=A0A7C9MEZ0_9RHOB|nr:glycosyltransferase family 2 protein [Kangsaoukella pontilimi]MXQ09151.1 glycosyltransferase family 92 protein [Kangsaoukella pontilimi]
MSVTDLGGGRCLDLTGTPARAVACFLSGTDPTLLRDALGARRLSLRQVGRGLRAVVSEVDEARLPEPDHLAGRRVMLAVRNGQSAVAASEWVAFHQRLGFDGVLILDRAAPDEAESFAQALGGMALGIPILHVTTDAPLGLPGAPDARDPALSPDGPKSEPRRSEDGRHSPLAEEIVFEALRHRFLAEARTVFRLDLTDYLLAEDARPLFDRLDGAPDKVLPLRGRELYVWPEGGAPDRLSDHIYGRRAETRWITGWAVAPHGLADDTVWRIAGVQGAVVTEPSAPMARAMGLVFPGAAPGALARAEALVEDGEASTIFTSATGYEPRRRPRPAQSEEERPALILTTMRNEGPFILDWLAHHRVVGVERFLIYTNDCDDGTDRLLDLLAAEGIVTHRDNPYRKNGGAPQRAAFRAAPSEPDVTAAGWILPLDVDEYLTIRPGEGRISDLMNAAPEGTVFSIPWRIFGSGDRVTFEDRPVTEQFHMAAPDFAPRPLQAWGFKTLYRNDGAFAKIGVHAPRQLDPERQAGVTWLDGSGRPFPEREWQEGWRMTPATAGYGLAQINHYAVRSAESFLVKRDRGRTNHTRQDQGLNYWFRMNFNGPENRAADRYAERVALEKARLLALPGVAEVHEAAVDWHRARIAALMRDPDYRALFEAITSDRMRALSRRLGHFGNNVFYLGPDVIPDEVATRDPGGDWTFSVPLPASD